MQPVAVRVVHGPRETVIDATGVRFQPVPSSSSHFELELTFHCGIHESVLRVGPDAREDEDQQHEGPVCLSALVGVERSVRVPRAIAEAPKKRPSRLRSSILQLVKPETTP